MAISGSRAAPAGDSIRECGGRATVTTQQGIVSPTIQTTMRGWGARPGCAGGLHIFGGRSSTALMKRSPEAGGCTPPALRGARVLRELRKPLTDVTQATRPSPRRGLRYAGSSFRVSTVAGNKGSKRPGSRRARRRPTSLPGKATGPGREQLPVFSSRTR